MTRTGARRQWGADDRTPLPAIPAPPSTRTIALGRTGIVITLAAWAAFVFTTAGRVFFSGHRQTPVAAAEAVSYLAIVTLLTGSALAYLATRLGYLYRARGHRRMPRAVLDELYQQTTPTMTVLVPSYREDARVVRKTLLSAALQEFPHLRVVLLIDDPPAPKTEAEQALLEAARALPAEISVLLAQPRRAFEQALEDFESSLSADSEPTVLDMRALTGEYEQAVAWLRSLAGSYERVDHTGTFFVDEVVLALASDLELVADALRAAADEEAVLPLERMRQLYRRLAWTFRAELSSFERKQFASLSAEANKAMNLNSYIGLMGGTYRTETTPLGEVLVSTPPGRSELVVPDADFVLTLDADSVLLPEYCVRLVYELEQEQNTNVAVIQTPYSAYPGSSTRLERIAGATTDIQHLLHQGLTHYDATFWVGANAILRKQALEDIVEIDRTGPFETRRYIQDRTVIEDTESSIDLSVHGWKLHNYPERLSYSATPPDFGSLCIQRQRWADGGLLILPKMWRNSQLRRDRGERARLSEVLLRVNYMGSIAWSSFSLLLLLCFPYDNTLLSPLVFLAALPYFLTMAGDLRHCGYKRLDVLRIYGFNLVLLPVNLSGVLKSIGQGITGQKIAFRRTPKVRNRTTAAASFVLMPYLLVLLSAFTTLRYEQRGMWQNAAFAALNAVLASYAIIAFIGLRNSFSDVWANIVSRLYKPAGDEAARSGVAAESPASSSLDWASVLHFGTATPPPNAPPAPTVGGPAAPRRPRAAGSAATTLDLTEAGGDGSGVAALLRALAGAGTISLRVNGPEIVLRLEPDEVELEAGR
jgi:cellulose synthase/poly-beta-1,6-N-acetylglucosamine synthase-like glycosyltransferase